MTTYKTIKTSLCLNYNQADVLNNDSKRKVYISLSHIIELSFIDSFNYPKSLKNSIDLKNKDDFEI